MPTSLHLSLLLYLISLAGVVPMICQAPLSRIPLLSPTTLVLLRLLAIPVIQHLYLNLTILPLLLFLQCHLSLLFLVLHLLLPLFLLRPMTPLLFLPLHHSPLYFPLLIQHLLFPLPFRLIPSLHSLAAAT